MGAIERVFRWAIAHKLHAGENPGHARRAASDALPAKAKAKHHAALPYADLPAFMVELVERDGVSAKALEFTILTAVRTSEAIGATWNEIDLDAAVWAIPASRMKAKRPSRAVIGSRRRYPERFRSAFETHRPDLSAVQYGHAGTAARHGRQWLHGSRFPVGLL